eukprot:6487049-Amphidinium_carterae.1
MVRSAGWPPLSGVARTRSLGRFHNWSRRSLKRQSPGSSECSRWSEGNARLQPSHRRGTSATFGYLHLNGPVVSRVCVGCVITRCRLHAVQLNLMAVERSAAALTAGAAAIAAGLVVSASASGAAADCPSSSRGSGALAAAGGQNVGCCSSCRSCCSSLGSSGRSAGYAGCGFFLAGARTGRK